jgi:signal transduction histidine kinase
MRLSSFILRNLEPILQSWEDFARTVTTPMPALDSAGLRNHAEKILKAVAMDMRTSQTTQQQIDKSQGLAPVGEDETAAQSHAVIRLMDGFTLDQMVSEYRALRSSVLRLWLARERTDDEHDVTDIIRFNEAIDQALVESIAAYSQAVEGTRKRVLGVLGHDLRSPLGAVLMASELLRKKTTLEQHDLVLATQIWTSVNRANAMVNDLLDLARSNLGAGMPLALEATELNGICRSVIDEIRTGHPAAQISFQEEAPARGRFDPARIAQVFANLIGNAVRHGELRKPIHVGLKCDGLTATFSVHNRGEPIPASAIPYLFNPEGRYSTYAHEEKGPSAGLGLGLFIAAQIAEGHGGRIEAASTADEGTVFRVYLPIT